MASGTIAHVREARRVMTFGVTGSGKSTLASALAERLGKPYISIDDVCWDANWTQPSGEEMDRRVIPLLQQDSFVIDSVYGRHNALAHERVDVIVALNYSRRRSLARLIKRTARRVIRKTPVCNGNIETLGRVLGRDSIIRWHFRSFASKRDRIERWERDPQVPPVIVLTHPRDTEALLAAL